MYSPNDLIAFGLYLAGRYAKCQTPAEKKLVGRQLEEVMLTLYERGLMIGAAMATEPSDN